jgi:hypothetical protein
MATFTISEAGGNWSDTSTWIEEQVPSNYDDIIATYQSGNLTIDDNVMCMTIDVQNYQGRLIFNDNVSIVILYTGFLGGCPSFTMVNPVNKIYFGTELVNVYYDSDRKCAIFNEYNFVNFI